MSWSGRWPAYVPKEGFDASVSWDSSAINRPRVNFEWQSETEVWFGLEWSNGNSDPVWSVDVSGVTVPRPLRWVMGQLIARRRRKRMRVVGVGTPVGSVRWVKPPDFPRSAP